MILTDPCGLPATTRIGARATLDELLHRAALRRPNALALVDAPNRATFTEGPPRRLTYAQADRMVSAIAGRLRRLGLSTDSIVGIQMANTVECVLTLLGALRAGLIAMPLPLLWRRSEAIAALNRVDVHALIVSGRIGAVDHFELAMQIAAEIFPIRHICGYGRAAPDGVVDLNDLFSTDDLDPCPPLEKQRADEPSAHVAAITWDVGPEGPIPVARNHAELIAGGLAIVLEGRVAQDALVLSTLTMSSFAGLAVAVVPWLLLGGTLALHQPFDADVLAEQCKALAVDTVVIPGPLAAQLAQSGHLTGERLRSVIGVWRTLERLPHAPSWHAAARLVDVQAFGETGMLAAAREADGKPARTTFGTVYAPRGSNGTVVAAEVAVTAHGTVALRGPMVPRASFPHGAERNGQPCLRLAADGFADTGYRCHADRADVAITGAPSGIIGVGGYRFVMQELQTIVKGFAGGAATLAVLPDALAGNRLAATCADPDTTKVSLTEAGASPLLVEAFRDRPRAA